MASRITAITIGLPSTARSASANSHSSPSTFDASEADLLDHRLRLASQLADKHVFAAKRPAELLDVLGVHAGQPVEPIRRIRRNADHTARANNSVRQPSRDRQRVRAPARTAGHREPLDTQSVGDRGHVIDAVDDLAAAVPRRLPVAGRS